MTTLLFYIFSILTIVSAIGVVSSKTPINSILSLIATFFFISCHYILLNAQFLGIVNMIVYAGAIMVLFLFTIMLLNLNKDSEPQHNNFIKMGAVIASGMLLIVLLSAFKDTININHNTLAVVHVNQVGLLQNLGTVLFTKFLVPFEISSVLFIAGVVGAVVLGKKEIGE
ncbi:MAG: NADH-quinone oxidoreductase subunit J [Bacteroidia bacterium]|jgi:NADH-quinone oxidoreductase subunit J